jgi:hypothetical protein
MEADGGGIIIIMPVPVETPAPVAGSCRAQALRAGDDVRGVEKAYSTHSFSSSSEPDPPLGQLLGLGETASKELGKAQV